MAQVILFCACLFLAQMVGHLGAGEVFRWGPAPQNWRLRSPVAQVSILFPHLRQIKDRPAPKQNLTCSRTRSHLLQNELSSSIYFYHVQKTYWPKNQAVTTHITDSKKHFQHYSIDSQPIRLRDCLPFFWMRIQSFFLILAPGRQRRRPENKQLV